MSKSINPHPEKALPHVVTALIDKRRQLAGQIENAQREVVRLTVELDHIEASLRILMPDLDLTGIGPRPVPTAHHAFRGEVSRILLTALREAVRPLSTTELTERVMKERNLDLKDAKLRQVMGKRIGASLNHWRRIRKAVESVKGPGQVLYWQIKPQPSDLENDATGINSDDEDNPYSPAL